ncbi:kelch repeat protein [Hymenopellis radicata]|nr:kelch repeat protein [Hymenopellis radicata]
MAPLEEKGAIWRYHTSQGLWDLIEPRDPFASFPVGRSYHCVASDDKDTIFVHAGCPETGRLADLWAFNVRSRTWTELPEAPSPARGGASITVCDGKLYRMNGFDGKAEQGGSLDIFDLGEAVWSSVSYEPNGVQGPEPRSVSALVAVKVQEQWHLLTMFGERDPSALGHAGAGKMLGDVWAFDVGHRKWAKIEPEGDGPAPRGWFGADVTKDKYAVIVHGGLAEDNSRLGDVWKLQFF